MTIPSCAEWKVWIGQEVEGTDETGVMTLFVRELKPDQLGLLQTMRDEKKINRIWFCREFISIMAIRVAMKLFDRVCLEILPQDIQKFPKDIFNGCKLYVKLYCPPLKLGDQLCVGIDFDIMAFQYGKGAPTTPDMYAGDVKIL